jgi:hypothetical protein
MNHKALFIVFIVLPLGLGHAAYGQNSQILSLEAALSWLSSNAVEGGSYTVTLGQNETVGPWTLSYSGKKVNITLSGGASERVISLNANGSLFTVESGVTLTLGGNVTLRGRSDNTLSLIKVNSGGTLMMNTGSKISGNSAEMGGGVFVEGCTFTMNGGTISGNSARNDGGGVHISDGTFTMSGGTISGNSITTTFLGSGGGVDVSGGTFTMSGGTISGNSASSALFGNGGGVCVGNRGAFIKQSGGIIYGSDAAGSLRNTARSDENGHAVYYEDSSSTKIRNTTAGSGVTLNSGLNGSAGGWE